MTEQFKKEIFRYYKVNRTSSLIDSDLKFLRKVNNLISKYVNTEKEKYKLEAINIIKSTGNLVNFNDGFTSLIREKIIDRENQQFFTSLVEESFDETVS